MKNSILTGVLVIIILVLGFLYMKEKNKPQVVNDYNFTNQTEEFPTGNNQTTNNYPVYTPPTQNVPPTTTQTGNQNTWVREPNSGIYYSNNFKITAQGDWGFRLTDTNNQVVINWGGDCTGFVSIAMDCINGELVTLGSTVMDSPVSEKGIKFFADFVLKNKSAQNVDNSQNAGLSGLLTQAQAESFVTQNWTDCSSGDCGGMNVEFTQDVGNLYMITAISNNYDDSVASTKKQWLVLYSNGQISLATNQPDPNTSWVCHPGRGHQTFETSNCI